MTFTVSTTCRIENCERDIRVKSKLLCSAHYSREKSGQDLNTPLNQPKNTSSVRDDQGRKKCSDCLQWKSVEFFGLRNRHADGLSYRCKECQRWDRYLKKYNITSAKIEKMLSVQDGCAICHINDPGVNNWQIDHDHTCCPVGPGGGKTCGVCVRGILCSPCNRMIGIAKEDTKILLSAVSYLEKD